MSPGSWRWASVAAWTAERRAASRTDNAARWPPGAWLGEVVAAQGLAGRPGRIQGIGLGTVAASGPLGPVQLHHLLGRRLQEPGQAGAIATGALNRPHSPAVVSVGQPSSCW
jgi:hypothetical protein